MRPVAPLGGTPPSAPPRAFGPTVTRRRTDTRAAIRIAVAIAVPPAAALAAIHADPFVSYAARRPGIVAVAMFCLAAAMLSARLRRWLLIAFAYGAALLAFRGAARGTAADAVSRIGVLASLYPWVWLVLLALAAAAGTLEAVRPGTVLAKRFLLFAASVYLCGHGVMGYLYTPNSVSVFAFLTGVGCAAAAVAAHSLARGEPEASCHDVPTAEQLARERAVLLARAEWHDTAP